MVWLRGHATISNCGVFQSFIRCWDHLLPRQRTGFFVQQRRFYEYGEAHFEAEDGHAVSHLAELALLWLIPLNSHQQIFFQLSPPLLEPLNLHFETIEALEALDDLAVLVTKRAEAGVCRNRLAHGLFIRREPCPQ